MSLLENSSVQNLYSLYKLLATYEDCINTIEKNGVISIRAVASVWPNLIYSNNEYFLKESTILNEIVNDIDNKILPPLVLVYNNNYDFEVLKKNGFYIIDQWILMNIKFESDLWQYKNDEYRVGKIILNSEISEWVSILSESLFSNKKLNEEIFAFLLSNNCELIYLKKETIIVGTTLIYYDVNNVAGIYMVCINPKFRGLGLGKYIMSYTLRCIQQKNINNVVLQSTKSGLPLYKSFGFIETGTVNLMYKIK